MTTTQTKIHEFADEDDRLRALNRRKGIAYARAAGIGTGIFLLIWLPLNTLRWSGVAPAGLLGAEWLIFGVTAIMMLLPWRWLESTRFWKSLLVVQCIASAAFVFMLVVDLMFLYMMAADQGSKPPPPAFQSALLFIVLMQPAAVIFQRRPELLD